MTAIFISHRSSDNAEAQALKDWLGQQGHERLFLDFDPADGIPAGVDWEQRLYRELRRCQALLIVLTPAWLESKWCSNELAIAREKGKAVFVVRVKPCPAGPAIPAIQEVDLTTDPEPGREKLARGLREHGLDPRDAFDWKPGRPIYPGLAAFDIEDAAIFFGRGEEAWAAIEALRRLRIQPAGSPKLLLITGASGSGKSSLMRAGILARLRKERHHWIVSRPFRRGADAIRSLGEALAWTYPEAKRPADLGAFMARLSRDGGATDLLGIAQELRFAWGQPEATVVLALDQAEELIGPDADGSATRLLELLRTALGGSARDLVAVATIRSDTLGGWQAHPSIRAGAERAELPFEAFPLGPMPMDRVPELVRGPARYVDLKIDDDLVDAIRQDTETPDALPLLAYTLERLHHDYGGDGRLTLAEYEALGRLEGSIREQANRAIAADKLPAEDLVELHEAFVPGLVRATADGGFARSRAPVAKLPAKARPYLDQLKAARLLVSGQDESGQEFVEIVHEALLRVWPTLAAWIREDAEKLFRLERIQQAAEDWENSARHADFLVHRDQRLLDAEALVAEPRFAARLDNPDRDYLTACRNAQSQREAAEKEVQERELRAAQQLAAEQKAKTRRTRIVLAAIGLLVLITAFSVEIFQLLAVAEGQKLEIGTARQGMLAAIAQRESERGNLDAALALALEASNASPSSSPDTFFARIVARLLGVTMPAADSAGARNPIATDGLRAVLSNYHEKRLLSQQSSAVVSTAISDDGRRILTVASDGDTLVTDVSTGQQLFKLKQAISPLYATALNADGSLAALASFPHETTVWSVDDQQKMFGLDINSVTRLRFINEEKSLAIATLDGSVLLASLDTHNLLSQSFKHSEGILSIDFSHLANRFGIGSIDGGALVWNPTDDSQLALQGHSAAVRRVRFSPDGTSIATASSDRTVIVWESSTGTQMAKLRGHEDWVTEVVFSPDGRELLTESIDRTVRLWDVGTQRERCRFLGHQERIAGAVFSGVSTVVTASYDGALRLWDTDRCVLRQTIRLSGSPITSLSPTFNGLGLVISDSKGKTWLWSTETMSIGKQTSFEEIVDTIQGMNVASLSCSERNSLLAESNTCAEATNRNEPFEDNRHFVEALYFVLKYEGGYVSNPADPGWATNKGILQRHYDAWRRAKGLAIRDIKDIGDDEVSQIFFEGYWQPPRCGLLPPSLGMLLFDTATNMGTGGAYRIMQEELGLDADGLLGPQLRAAVAESGQTNLAARFVDRRRSHYQALASRRAQFAEFLPRWLRRLDDVAKSIGLDDATLRSALPKDSSEP